MHEQRIATSGFILNSNGKFLIVKRAQDDDILPGFWELPGGKLDFGEDPEDGALREIKEETGLDVVIEFLLKAVSYIIEETGKSEHHYVEVSYLCHIKDTHQEVTISHEHDDFRWIKFEELPTENITELMTELIKGFADHPLIKKL